MVGCLNKTERKKRKQTASEVFFLSLSLSLELTTMLIRFFLFSPVAATANHTCIFNY